MIRGFREHFPSLTRTAWVAPSAEVIGQVSLGEGASIWFNSVVRADVGPIRIGRRTNVQDLSVIHVLKDRFSTTLGDEVTVGHRVILHGCTVADRVLIGMGAIVLDGAEIGEGCVIAAGTLIPPGARIPPGSLVVGSPGKVKRPVTEAERAWIVDSAAHYVDYARAYAEEA